MKKLWHRQIFFYWYKNAHIEAVGYVASYFKKEKNIYTRTAQYLPKEAIVVVVIVCVCSFERRFEPNFCFRGGKRGSGVVLTIRINFSFLCIFELVAVVFLRRRRHTRL